MKGMDQRIHSFYVADKTVVKKHDQPFAACGSMQFMQSAGWSDPDISLLKNMRNSIDQDSVLIAHRHDDLHGSMPVERIIFRFIIVIKFHAAKGIVSYCFANTVQNFYHM